MPLVAVIDDDDSFRSALVESLLSVGYGARGFSSADEFVALEAEGSCDCVIADIHMPGMSGLDLVRQLAARDSKVPMILITARAEPDMPAKAATGGVVSLLIKPFRAKALVDSLKMALAAEH
jgi:FixJ family two-component response regulator